MDREFFSESFAKAAIAALFTLTLLAFVFVLRDSQQYAAKGEEPVPTSHAPALAVQPPVANPGMKKLQGSAQKQSPVQQARLLENAMKKELQKLQQRLEDAQAQNRLLEQEMAALPESFALEYAGEFHATAYCCEVYPHICGGNGVTASGTIPTPGVTCAADWEVFPPGTWLYIEEVGVRRVEDSGSAIKGERLDIAVDTHENALKWPGFGNHRVWVLQLAEGIEKP